VFLLAATIFNNLHEDSRFSTLRVLFDQRMTQVVAAAHAG
jgi:hypothetical protein